MSSEPATRARLAINFDPTQLVRVTVHNLDSGNVTELPMPLGGLVVSRGGTLTTEERIAVNEQTILDRHARELTE